MTGNAIRKSPAWIFGGLWVNRQLVVQLIKRDVFNRYRGSSIGLVWSFLNPLMMLAVYTTVFGVFFAARWGDRVLSKWDFAIMIFAGMIVHGFLADCLTRAPFLIVGNPSYVKKVIFPLDILVWVNIGSSLFHFLMSLFVLLLFVFIAQGSVPSTVPLIIPVLIPLILFGAGVAWVLSSLGVYVRDVAQVSGMLSTILLFLSPVFYSADSLPGVYRTLLVLNPLTLVIENARAVLIYGESPSWALWVIQGAGAFLFAWLGLVWFQKTRSGFADVL